jgi:DNA modification methylase
MGKGKTAAPSAFRNRIVGEGEEAPDQLLANPLNWRVHPKEQQDALEGLLKQVGWVQRVIVNKRTGHVVDGHARVALALRRNEPTLPVLYVDLSEAEERLVLAAIDPIGGMAGRDDDMLAQVLDGLTAEDAGLQALLDSLKGEEAGSGGGGGGDPDVTPDVQPDPVTEPGDVWLLGGHRVMCGDSTSLDAVEALLKGQKAGMVFTDPPYGVSFQSGMSKGGTASRFDVLRNDDTMLEIAPVVWAVMADDCAAFIWTSHQVYPQWRAQFADFYKQTLIWHKPGGGIGDLAGSYACDFEMALFCVKGRPTFNGKRGMAVWQVAKDAAITYQHPTQKPVELAERAINDFCPDGASVLDLFGGSGSTMIAAEKTGRRALLMELDPRYCDVIVRRWQAFTGKAATLEGDGRTFDEIAAERVPAEA